MPGRRPGPLSAVPASGVTAPDTQTASPAPCSELGVGGAGRAMRAKPLREVAVQEGSGGPGRPGRGSPGRAVPPLPWMRPFVVETTKGHLAARGDRWRCLGCSEGDSHGGAWRPPGLGQAGCPGRGRKGPTARRGTGRHPQLRPWEAASPVHGHSLVAARRKGRQRGATRTPLCLLGKAPPECQSLRSGVPEVPLGVAGVPL